MGSEAVSLSQEPVTMKLPLFLLLLLLGTAAALHVGKSSLPSSSSLTPSPLSDTSLALWARPQFFLLWWPQLLSGKISLGFRNVT